MRTAILISFLAISVCAFAQTLPKVQQISMRAPANTKVDGKATEWGDKFEAYNPGSRVFYTMANDDTNLYLYFKMDGSLATSKVLYGGAQLSINSIVKKTPPAVITYHAATASPELEKLEFARSGLKTYMVDPVANKHKIDSMMIAGNKLIVTIYKQILVEGVPEIKERLLSIYNNEGILAASLFDNKMEYIYELAIPLKYLTAFTTAERKIKYSLQINPIPVRKNPGTFDPPKFNPALLSIDDLYRNEPTSFNGEYTLAK